MSGTDAAKPASISWRRASLCFLLALLTVGGFLPVSRNDFVNYDALVHQGKSEAAARSFREALRLRPDFPDAT